MKKINRLFIYSVLLTIITVIASCSKENNSAPDPAVGLTKITEGFVAGAATRVEVYSQDPTLQTGYAKFYLALFDSVTGNRIEEAHIKLSPMMDMGTMQHSCPYENPTSETAVNKLFPFSVVFIMPSTGGNWTLKINVHNHVNDKEGFLTIPLSVTDPALSKLKSFTAAHDGNKYFIALIGPASPKIGINDMEIAIYKKVSMMSFPADSSLSVVLTPEMPTMGHGSPNNVNPTHINMGHYKGKVNFTMTGLWRLNLDFNSGAAVADSTQYFDIEF